MTPNNQLHSSIVTIEKSSDVSGFTIDPIKALIISTPNNQLNSPIVTIEKFSDISGLTVGSIRALIGRGILPTIKVGKRRMINVALIEKEALSQKQ